MKKFWEKYKILIIVVLAVAAFIGLSIFSEAKSTPKESGEISEGILSWKEGVESEEYAITVISLSYCPHCKNYKPIISEIAEEYSLPLYWFDIDELSKVDSSSLTDTYNFSKYDGSSPYTAITSKGEVVNQTVGEMDKEATLDFLRTNGVIE